MKNNKLIKVLYTINYVWFFITIALFITIYFGLLAEILLGAIQVISSLLVLFYWKELQEKQKDKLRYYWIITGIYLTLWLFDWGFLNDWFLFIVGIGLIPMGIATYFLMILKSIRKEEKTSGLIQKIGIS